MRQNRKTLSEMPTESLSLITSQLVLREQTVDMANDSAPGSTIYSTIWSEDPYYNERVVTLDWRKLGSLRMALGIFRARPDDVVIVNGALGFPARWRDMLSACAARALGRRFRLVVSDATWEPRSMRDESTASFLWRINERLSKWMVRYLNNGQTTFCFLSTAEVDGFLADTGCSPQQAVFTPFCVTAPPPELVSRLSKSHGFSEDLPPYIFAGGNTLRDWELLIDGLGDLDIQVRVATSHTGRQWPDNFVVGPVPAAEFFHLASRATVGVVTLRSDIIRSAGQQTYLNLLSMGVPVVVNDAPGVREHLEDIPGAFIIPPDDAEALRRRVAWLIDEENRATVEEMVRAGKAVVDERFGPAAYLKRLVSLAQVEESDYR
jgi:hypothetical protein